MSKCINIKPPKQVLKLLKKKNQVTKQNSKKGKLMQQTLIAKGMNTTKCTFY